MSLPAGVLIMGAVFGSLYALGALGIVLVYRADRVINFAQAELGVVGAVIAIQMRSVWELPYVVCVLGGLVVAAIIGALVRMFVIERFRKSSRLVIAVATLGIAEVTRGLGFLIPSWWKRPKTDLLGPRFEAPTLFPKFSVDPFVFGTIHLVALLLFAAVVVTIVVFLKKTSWGLAIRASADNPTRAGLVGMPVRKAAVIVWAAAAVLSALAIVLQASLLSLNEASSLAAPSSSMLMRLLAPALLARLNGFGVTAAGGISLGILEQAALWNTSDAVYVEALIAVVVIIAIASRIRTVRDRSDLSLGVLKDIPPVRPLSPQLMNLAVVKRASVGVFLGAAAVALVLPGIVSDVGKQIASLILIYAVLALSLILLTGWGGQISLGQFAIAGIGGAAGGTLIEMGWDLFIALPVAMIAGGICGILIGIPAIKARGPMLAVTTLALAVVASRLLLEDRYFDVFVPESVTRPVLWGRFDLASPAAMYYLCLGAFILVLMGLKNLRASRAGRAIIGLRENEPATMSAGVVPTVLKIQVFGLSGAIAGLAGALYVLHQLGLNTESFGPDVSLKLFSMVVVGGVASLSGAILGALYITGGELLFPAGWSFVISGVGILLLLMFAPGGLSQLLFRARDWILSKLTTRDGAESEASSAVSSPLQLGLEAR